MKEGYQCSSGADGIATKRVDNVVGCKKKCDDRSECSAVDAKSTCQFYSDCVSSGSVGYLKYDHQKGLLCRREC